MAIWGGLTNSCEKKGSKKQRRKRYKHVNAEFQRIARRDKKAFFSDQCKEIAEENRMGKTRDLFKKIRDTKGTLLGFPGSSEVKASACNVGDLGLISFKDGLEKEQKWYGPKRSRRY